MRSSGGGFTLRAPLLGCSDVKKKYPRAPYAEIQGDRGEGKRVNESRREQEHMLRQTKLAFELVKRHQRRKSIYFQGTRTRAV